MVALTFPDGARREYPDNSTGLDIAKGISPSLAKRTVAMALDGTVADLADPIKNDARIEFLTRDDPRALELIRHDAAHVLAEAVQSLTLAGCKFRRHDLTSLSHRGVKHPPPTGSIHAYLRS